MLAFLAVVLTINLCAPHPLRADVDICEVRYTQSFADEALCERAIDLDGDGSADQVWIDVSSRLTQDGQYLELRCPLRAYRVAP